jgi:LysM repeat protein
MLFRDVVKPESQEKRFKMFSLPIVVGVVAVHFIGAAVLFASPKKEPLPQLPEPLPTPMPMPAPVVTNSLENAPKVAAVPQPSPVKKAGEGPRSSITSTYTVKSGDTFYSIVRKFKLNPQNLIKLNSIEDPSKLKSGQVLKFVN